MGLELLNLNIRSAGRQICLAVEEVAVGLHEAYSPTHMYAEIQNWTKQKMNNRQPINPFQRMLFVNGK